VGATRTAETVPSAPPENLLKLMREAKAKAETEKPAAAAEIALPAALAIEQPAARQQTNSDLHDLLRVSQDMLGV